MIKDFDHFVDRRFKVPETKSVSGKVFSNMLSFLDGDKWKAMRTKLTPIFTSGKLRNMKGLIEKVRRT